MALSMIENSDNAWFPDTGASNYMTADPGKLNSVIHYYCPEKIMVGNGKSIDITHIGTTTLDVGNTEIRVDNVLVVPDIKKSLISVSQLTSDLPYIIEFSSSSFVIRDREAKSVIATGIRSNDLYVGMALFSNWFRTVTMQTWHQRLGHPHLQVVKHFEKNKFIQSSSNKTDHLSQVVKLPKHVNYLS